MKIPLKSATIVAALGLIGGALLNEWTSQWWINAAMILLAGVIILADPRVERGHLQIDRPSRQIGWVRLIGGAVAIIGALIIGALAFNYEMQVTGRCALARQMLTDTEELYALGLRTDSHSAAYDQFKKDVDSWWKDTNGTLRDHFADKHVSLKAPAAIDCPSAFDGQLIEYGGYIHGICTAIDNLRRLAQGCE